MGVAMSSLIFLTMMVRVSFAGETLNPLQPSGAPIARLERALSEKPESITRRVDLLQALVSRARLTGERVSMQRAKALLAESKKENALHQEIQKAEIEILLLEKKHEDALRLAKAMNKKTPDDLDVYGYLVDALSAFGRYDEAEEQAKWMIRLRQHLAPTMKRVAELREAFGDREGSLLMLNEMYRSFPGSEDLERAWVMARIARLTADPARSEKLARKALEIAPESLEGTLALANALMAQKQPDSAVPILEAAYERTGREDVFHALAMARGEK